MVLDTNVLVAAARSGRGASAKLLSLLGGAPLGEAKFEICISVPLVIEYEEVLLRHLKEGSQAQEDWSDILDYICRIATKQDVFFLWRPLLRDSKDDMVLELAVAAGCDAIVTYNKRDFAGVDRFGLRVWEPKELLIEIGELS